VHVYLLLWDTVDELEEVELDEELDTFDTGDWIVDGTATAASVDVIIGVFTCATVLPPSGLVGRTKQYRKMSISASKYCIVGL